MCVFGVLRWTGVLSMFFFSMGMVLDPPQPCPDQIKWSLKMNKIVKTYSYERDIVLG